MVTFLGLKFARKIPIFTISGQEPVSLRTASITAGSTGLKRTRTTTLPMGEVSSHGDELDTSTRSGYILRFHRKFRPFRHRSRSSRS